MHLRVALRVENWAFLWIPGLYALRRMQDDDGHRLVLTEGSGIASLRRRNSGGRTRDRDRGRLGCDRGRLGFHRIQKNSFGVARSVRARLYDKRKNAISGARSVRARLYDKRKNVKVGVRSVRARLYDKRKNAKVGVRSVRARLYDKQKMQLMEQEASGHDFSRAVNTALLTRALAPVVCFS